MLYCSQSITGDRRIVSETGGFQVGMYRPKKGSRLKIFI